jgi:hypothetical protein
MTPDENLDENKEQRELAMLDICSKTLIFNVFKQFLIA